MQNKIQVKIERSIEDDDYYFQVLNRDGIPATWGGLFSPDPIQAARFMSHCDARRFCKYWGLNL